MLHNIPKSCSKVAEHNLFMPIGDDKNTQHVHNICCSWIKIDLRCNFIVMILTRTGLHTFARRSFILGPLPGCYKTHSILDPQLLAEERLFRGGFTIFSKKGL